MLRFVVFTSHSPRVGYATELLLLGVSLNEIKERVRHNVDGSLRVYLDFVMLSRTLVADQL